MKDADKKSTIERYNKRIQESGFTDAALGWTRDNNITRFRVIADEWREELDNSSVFDFGCGYGEFYNYLKGSGVKDIKYTGLDINDTLIEEAQNRYPEASFLSGDLFEMSFPQNYDFIFSSGVYNHKLSETDEYDFIFKSIEKLFSICNKGIAVNFLSDKVEYFTEHNFNANPGKIIEFFYSMSNNIVLRNNYMPFEFTVFLRKDKTIDKDRLVYS